MGNNKTTTIGNGLATENLIADSFDFVIDPQVTNLQIWNLALLTANRNGADVVGSLKHDIYPYGFNAVILLLDGHIAIEYGVALKGLDAIGTFNILISTNGGPSLQEKLRAAYRDAYLDLLP